jgi:hypothetical protein
MSCQTTSKSPYDVESLNRQVAIYSALTEKIHTLITGRRGRQMTSTAQAYRFLLLALAMTSFLGSVKLTSEFEWRSEQAITNAPLPTLP